MFAQQLQFIAESYVNLLIIQYHDKPKAKATMALLVNETLSDGIINDIRDGLNIDIVQGKQLDLLGKYIGLNRLVLALATSIITFGLTPYDTTFWKDNGYGGFVLYKEDINSINVGTLIAYEDSQNGTEIDDTSYRLLLKLENITKYIKLFHR